MLRQLRQRDFFWQDDFAVSAICDNCGRYLTDIALDEALDDGARDSGKCPDCGCNNLIFTTAHEDDGCIICHRTFDKWDGVWKKRYDDILVCDKCYDSLEE